MKINTKKIVKITKGERMLYTLGILCFILTIVTKVFSSASISNLKMDIEHVSYNIENQEKKNQSLVMQVNELTSYENLSEVAKEQGLTYKNENIIVEANGKNVITKVEILNPSILADKEILEDIIFVAVNDVLEQIKKEKEHKLGKYTGGLGGLF